MDWLDYAFILAAYVAAGGIKGLTGIGFSTSCLPIMALRLDLKVAIPLVIVPSIVSNLAVMLQAGRFREDVISVGAVHLCRSCICAYCGLLICGIFLAAARPPVTATCLTLAATALATLALSGPWCYKRLPRIVRDTLR